MKPPTREQRDWTLLVFIIPIGIILMLVAGQIAIRLAPLWSITAEMRSNLNPNLAPKRQTGLVQPIGPGILTPYDVNLTPDPGSVESVVFPPFVVIEPNATPSVTVSPEPTEPPTIPVTASPSPTTVETETATATNTPTSEPTLPAATAASTATATATSNTTATPTATATAPSVASTLDPSLTLVSPPPPVGTPDGTNTPITAGAYVIVDLAGGSFINVSGSSETNYDFVNYESEYINGTTPSGNVRLDHMIVGISQYADAHIFYEVLNWGNNIRDTNTNVDTNRLPADLLCLAPFAPECDNREIPISNLYPYPGIGTGILIDVDNALSAPPIGSYQYIVIISPPGGGDAVQVDAIKVSEVPR